MNKILYDSKIKHLSESEINSLLSDYENNLPTKKIIEKYKLNAAPKELPLILPPIESTEKCPFCNVHMYVKAHRLTTKAGAAFCIICDHKQVGNCSCAKCKEVKENTKAFKKAKQVIASTDLKEDLSDLSDLGKLIFASILFSYYNEDTNIIYIPKNEIEKGLLRVLDCLSFYTNVELLLPILTESSFSLTRQNDTEFNYLLNLSPDAYDSFLKDYINNTGKIEVSIQSALLFWRFLQVSIALQYIEITCPLINNCVNSICKLNDELTACVELSPISLAKLLSLIDLTKEKADIELSSKECTEEEYLTLFVRTLNNLYFTTAHENVPAKIIPSQLMTSIPIFFFSRFLETPLDGYTKAPDEAFLKEYYHEEK